ncbi:phytanoyl-CoA dioxygenase family protein [Verticiella sediminum]|uniref:Phytanoyl-CoA dioxygenase family protein n=1 Tax=Verticiella sediminum TaxID=1247510 RepID=A0A556AJR4_9BURK|nr:phytanoyl-CoA dioxygenase family protein [Verticiella sediminum]
MLTPTQVRQFVRDGYVCLPNAFSPELAEAARAILWRDTGCSPDDRASWRAPVIRLGWYAQPPFAAAAASPRLHAAFDQLVGPGRWLPPGPLGTFPIRFPSPEDPGDAGWHIDPGFGFETHPDDFLAWRTNLHSRGRALLLLFLFSDVGRHDAPTRLRVGSHRHVARRLAQAGEAGLSLRELAADGFAESAGAPEMQATGRAGTVYLCHPFLVHAAQPHRGTRPRFMAQPPLLPTEPFSLAAPAEQAFPVELAIRAALAETPPPRRRRIVHLR